MNNKGEIVSFVQNGEIIEIYIKYAETYIFYRTCHISRMCRRDDIIEINDKLFIVKSVHGKTVYADIYITEKYNYRPRASEKIELYIKDSYSDKYKFYKTYKVNIKYKTGDIIEVNGVEFKVTYRYKDTVYIDKLEEYTNKEVEILKVREIYYFYAKLYGNSSYKCYTSGVLDKTYKIGDILNINYNRFIVKRIEDKIIYIEKI